MRTPTPRNARRGDHWNEAKGVGVDGPPAHEPGERDPGIVGGNTRGVRPGGDLDGGLRIYPQRNCLDRETALRMWTENVTWFSNEEGKKGRIQVGHLADLIVPDRDYFSCTEWRREYLSALR